MRLVARITNQTPIIDIPSFAYESIMREALPYVIPARLGAFIAVEQVAEVVSQNQEAVMWVLQQLPDNTVVNYTLNLAADENAEGLVTFLLAQLGDSIFQIDEGPTREYVIMDSLSEPNLTYRIDFEDGTPVSCTCKGFENRRRCKHLTLAMFQERRAA